MIGRRAIRSRCADERGMALLLVISVISVLTVVILQFNRSMRFGMVETARYQDREVLRAVARSGVDIGCAVLRVDRSLNEFDSLLEGWALLGDERLRSPFVKGELHLTVSNLDGRFPINRLVAVAREGQNQQGEGGGADQEGGGLEPEQAQEMLFRLLNSGQFIIEDESEARDIVDSLVDWLDSDDIESPYGAESSYYQSLEKPYRPRNGPIEFIEELALVKGVSNELLYGNDEKSGLKDYISVYNDTGKININTAPARVFQAFDDRISGESVEIVDEYRRDNAVADTLESSSWYRTVRGWPGDIVLDDKILTTQGTYFLLESQAEYQESTMTLTTVVKRVEDEEIQIMYVRVK